MQPAPVSDRAKEAYPKLQLFRVSAPEGVPEEECGTVEALVGTVESGIFDGGPVMRSYWVLDDSDIEALKNGAVLELTFFSNGMPMHGLKVF